MLVVMDDYHIYDLFGDTVYLLDEI